MRSLPFAVAIAFVLVACKSSSDDSHQIVASDYDQKCTQDTDCIAVLEGTDGCCGLTACTNAAINVSSEAQYEEDVTARKETCDPAPGCPAIACAPYSAVCTSGVCAVGAVKTAHPG